jgi:hypothetical protein
MRGEWAMITLLLACLVTVQQEQPHSIKRTYTYRGNAAVGETVMLGIEGQVLGRTQTFAVVATNKSYLADQVKFYISGDMESIDNLRDERRLLDIPTGTKAKVIAKDTVDYQNAKVFCYQVKILEGTQKDKTVYVITSFLITTKDELTQEEKERQKKQRAANAKSDKEAQADHDKQNAEKYAEIKLTVAKKYQREGDKDLAVRYLEELLRLYPNSKVAPEARDLLKSLGGK